MALAIGEASAALPDLTATSNRPQLRFAELAGVPLSEKPKVEFEIHSGSRPSIKHPERNDDVQYQFPQKGLYGLFDSNWKGGPNAGVIARERIATIAAELPDDPSIFEARNVVGTLIKESNAAVQEHNKHNKGNEVTTTASLVYMARDLDGSPVAVVGNVGHSRVYHLSGDTLRQVTLDDSATYDHDDPVGSYELQNRLGAVMFPKDELNLEDQALYSERNKLTQVVGFPGEPVDPRLHNIRLSDGDKIIILTNGIENLTDDQIAEILRNNQTPQAVIKILSTAEQISTDSGFGRAHPDDMTLMVADVTVTGVRQIHHIHEAESLEELSALLRRTQGSTELLGLVHDVMDRKKPPESLPAAESLQYTVKRLLGKKINKSR